MSLDGNLQCKSKFQYLIYDLRSPVDIFPTDLFAALLLESCGTYRQFEKKLCFGPKARVFQMKVTLNKELKPPIKILMKQWQ